MDSLLCVPRDATVEQQAWFMLQDRVIDLEKKLVKVQREAVQSRTQELLIPGAINITRVPQGSMFCVAVFTDNPALDTSERFGKALMDSVPPKYDAAQGVITLILYDGTETLPDQHVADRPYKFIMGVCTHVRLGCPLCSCLQSTLHTLPNPLLALQVPPHATSNAIQRAWGPLRVAMHIPRHLLRHKDFVCATTFTGTISGVLSEDPSAVSFTRKKTFKLAKDIEHTAEELKLAKGRVIDAHVYEFMGCRVPQVIEQLFHIDY